MVDVDRPGIDPRAPLRIARPSRDLAAAERFWCEGLGLAVLYRAGGDAEGGHGLLMLGWPDAAWHLELVDDAALHATARPTPEDLLVLYLGHRVEPGTVVRLERAGGRQVTSRNPYWERYGVTIADPDGYLLVLSHRSWPTGG